MLFVSGLQLIFLSLDGARSLLSAVEPELILAVRGFRLAAVAVAVATVVGSDDLLISCDAGVDASDADAAG